LLPWADRGLAEAQAMMPTPTSFLRDRLARKEAAKGATRQVTYFVGCAIDCALPDIGESTVQFLEHAGFEAVVAANVCCGLPPYAYGDREGARALARKNLEALSSLEGEVVTDCASCASFLRDYPSLFEPDDPVRPEAEKLAARVRELSEFLASRELPADLRPVEAVVTYHDPCHLSRYHQVTKQPRDLLRRIAGLTYRELPEADWCCGGAGSYALTHYDLSMQILARKMENIRSTAAQIVVTTCPACITQLRYGARRFDVPVEVLHLSEVLRRALPESG
jgi:glycolate oxidase iron-sulfur subunit